MDTQDQLRLINDAYAEGRKDEREEWLPVLEALKGLDEAYCRAGLNLTREERHEDRMRLIAARAAIAKVAP
jgi:hypothetical protein